MISPEFKAVKGMLGTTFGGNYLACAAALAVLNIIEAEGLVENARKVGEYLLDGIRKVASQATAARSGQAGQASPRIVDVRGRGLMIGIEFDGPVAELRRRLLYDKHIFTGVAGQNMVRLLPPLCLTREDADRFLSAFNELLQ